MGKTSKVVVCGMKGVGKTAILEQAIYGTISMHSSLHSTIEDVYVACIETERGSKERVRLYDTAGVESVRGVLLWPPAVADGYLLVYDTSRPETLEAIVAIKKEIDKTREKKEVVVIVLGNHMTENETAIPLESPVSKASHWCIREKIRHFEVNALDRTTLNDPFVQLALRLNPVPSKSTFPQLMVRKNMRTDNS